MSVDRIFQNARFPGRQAELGSAIGAGYFWVIGTLDEAIAALAAVDDVYERADRTIRNSTLQGTQRIRSHLEVDPRIGLTSAHAMAPRAQDERLL